MTEKLSDRFTSHRRLEALIEDLIGYSILNADSFLLGRTEILTAFPKNDENHHCRANRGSSWLREASMSTRFDRGEEEQREKKEMVKIFGSGSTAMAGQS